MMFYALEEDIGYKIPVIFVHGINGSPREFAEIVKYLDRRLYRPWFFYYPSGNDLGQLSEDYSRMEKHLIRHYTFVFEALVSGKVAPENPPLEHFVKACRGEVPATTPAETAWIKYRKEHREK